MFMDLRVTAMSTSETHNVEYSSWNLLVCATARDSDKQAHFECISHSFSPDFSRCSVSLNDCFVFVSFYFFFSIVSVCVCVFVFCCFIL